MRIERIVEIGVAVKNLQSTSKKYVEILGAIPSEILPADQYGNRCQICRIADVDLRLMEPTRDNETSKLIKKRHSDWLSYIGLRVRNIDGAITSMKKNNIRMIDEAPRAENGVRFAFIHPDSFRGVLLKLVEGSHGQRYLPQLLVHKAIPTAAKIERLYHIGVNVTNLEIATQLYTTVLGTKPSRVRIVNLYDMRITMNRLHDIDFELLCPLHEDGIIGRSIAKIGEGLAHLAFLVPDVEAAIAWMMQNGIRMIDKTPKQPLKPLRIAFTYPAAFNGVMFELIEGQHGLFG